MPTSDREKSLFSIQFKSSGCGNTPTPGYSKAGDPNVQKFLDAATGTVTDNE